MFYALEAVGALPALAAAAVLRVTVGWLAALVVLAAVWWFLSPLVIQASLVRLQGGRLNHLADRAGPLDWRRLPECRRCGRRTPRPCVRCQPDAGPQSN